MAPEQGITEILTIQINTQYRMVANIEEMASFISLRNLRTRILPPDRTDMTNPERGERVPPIIYRGLLIELEYEDVTPHTLCTDQNVHNQNLNLHEVRDLKVYVQHFSENYVQ